MTDKEQEHLNKIVDKSGFPLQLKLEDIQSNAPNWKVEGQELYWEIEGHSGFIDSVYGHSILSKKVITEVKKTSGGEWIFMIDRKRKKRGSGVITLNGVCRSMGDDVLEWSQLSFEPIKTRSAFCIVSGQNEGNPMLERLCTQILMATEAFAKNDYKSRYHVNDDRSTYYYPVIITNTPLYLCTYDTSDVDLETGIIKGKKDFEEIKSIIFQKPLWTRLNTNHPVNYSSFYQLNEAQDRSVLIVHSTEFFNFLNTL